MKKRRSFLSLLFLGFIAFGLAACGPTPTPGPGPDQGGNGGGDSTSVVAKDWKDIDESNCIEILKEKTGIDLSTLGNFTVTFAMGTYTKTAEISAKYGEGATKVNMFENFIKELLRVSNNSVWTTDVDNETYKIKKVDEYKDYQSLYNWEIKGNEDLSLNLEGGLYIENYLISYNFSDTQFNVRVAYNVIK